jgi:hypothetical protein
MMAESGCWIVVSIYSWLFDKRTGHDTMPLNSITFATLTRRCAFTPCHSG